MEASLKDRLAVASALILQSPPGEVNDVFNDVRPIVGDDSELERGLLPALAQYNTEQLALVELPNAKIPAMICSAAKVDPSSSSSSSSSSKEGEGGEGDNRYLDPHSQQTFVFDHLRLSASELAPHVPPDPQMEKTRSELQALAEAYIKNHFQNAVSTVFSLPSSDSSNPSQVDQAGQDAVAPPSADPPLLTPSESEPEIDTLAQTSSSNTDQLAVQSDTQISPASSSSSKFKLYIVGNKYNPTNYWTGRWRSIYEIDMESGKIEGSILVNVHYYEQGNVQLSTKHSPKIEVPSPTNEKSPKEIMKAIQTAESQYQAGLNSAYSDLGEHTFKLLRRALPVTKQKINWNNIKSRIVLDDH